MIHGFYRLSFIFFPTVVFVLLVAKLVIANDLVQLGRRIQTISHEVETISNENETLEQQIASSSAILAIEEKASILGFVTTSRYYSLNFQAMPVAISKTR